MSLPNPPTKEEKKADHSRKLDTAEKKAEMIRMLAEFKTYKEFQEEFLEKFGVKVSQNTFYHHRSNPEIQERVAEIRKQFLENIADVAGAHKRVRMERLERAYIKAEKNDDITNMINAVKQQQVEIEGKHGEGRITFNTQFVNISNQDLEERKMRVLQQIEQLKERGVIHESKRYEIEERSGSDAKEGS